MLYLERNGRFVVAWLAAITAIIVSAGYIPASVEGWKLVPGALVASVSAIFTAMIAFDAASLKTDLDEKIHLEKKIESEIGVLFKFQFELMMMNKALSRELTKQPAYPRYGVPTPDVDFEGLEFPEAFWQGISSMPHGSQASIMMLAYYLRELHAATEGRMKRNFLSNCYEECELILNLILEREMAIAPALSPDEISEKLNTKFGGSSGSK